jgi:peptidyl-prolyl cis-trans isomerase SurA
VARQNKVDVAQLHRMLAQDGVTVEAFRAQLRDQQILARLHEREVESRIRVSEQDIDRYLLDQRNASTDPFMQEINLAQILIAIPEKTTANQLPALQKQTQAVLERIRNGEDFSTLVQTMSGADRAKGGELGLRRADRYPRSFVLATQSLNVGEVSEVVRSGAGFHILKVVEKRAPSTVVKSVLQSRARHILLRTTPQLPTAMAIARLADLKKRIQAGSITFSTAAREHSQDSTSSDGGDLGWAGPGMFVPEFEEAMASLVDGEISTPVVSRFGVHLIMLVERRKVDLDPRQLRDAVRNELRSQRTEEAFSAWSQDVRARAFVDFREAPQ